MNVYFSDFFNVSRRDLKEYGALNISLINDLPVFIDPFLLFNSKDEKYIKLHDEIITYIRFLKDKSQDGKISEGLFEHWFLFPEVKQNWLGFSKKGNGGTGLGKVFGLALNSNLEKLFADFGEEKLTKSSHLEKLCLVKEKVGKDNISDFTTNLIKGYLCEYTQTFALKYININQVKNINVDHAYFNYETGTWMSSEFMLPYIDGDYVLLCPKNILTKDDTWINKHDIIGDFDEIVRSMPNSQLRANIESYFISQLPETENKKKPKEKDINAAIAKTFKKFVILLDYYIRHKEKNGQKAVAISEEKLDEIETIFVKEVSTLVLLLQEKGIFYNTKWNTLEEAYNRVIFLKHVIENNDGYRVFYIKGNPVKRESDLQLMFRLTWYASSDDVNAEVNNGRGPVDYKISRGAKDTTLVEFKLASNAKLKQNLANQVEVYKLANQTKKTIKVILYFSEIERKKTLKIMGELDLKEGKSLVLIDANNSNKPSGSNA